jgi:hypothetical protein
MPTIEIPWINEEFVPIADPDDLKTLWNMGVATKELMELHGTNDISQIRGADGIPLYTDIFWKLIEGDANVLSANFRGTMISHVIRYVQSGELELPGIDQGKPSDAVFEAFAKVPMKVIPPNVEHDSPPFDMEELIQLIEK